MKKSFTIVRKGSGWTATGPTPDTILSRHASYETARAAFDRVNGPACLVDPAGVVIDRQIV
jgi:hypothetical protein